VKFFEAIKLREWSQIVSPMCGINEVCALARYGGRIYWERQQRFNLRPGPGIEPSEGDLSDHHVSAGSPGVRS
jgi:hypothetical protein